MEGLCNLPENLQIFDEKTPLVFLQTVFYSEKLVF